MHQRTAGDHLFERRNIDLSRYMSWLLLHAMDSLLKKVQNLLAPDLHNVAVAMHRLITLIPSDVNLASLCPLPKKPSGRVL